LPLLSYFQNKNKINKIGKKMIFVRRRKSLPGLTRFAASRMKGKSCGEMKNRTALEAITIRDPISATT
jgi:hypothetical protein